MDRRPKQGAFLFKTLLMKSCLLFFLLLIGVKSLAQEVKLPLDERGKLIYYEVVDKPGTSIQALQTRASRFFKGNKDVRLITGHADSTWTASGKFIINKTAFVLSHPSGEVLYQFYIDFKADKYRFWLTDFNFIPYQRDRYSNFVPATTIGIPLERKPGKLNAGEWESYVKATAREAGVFATRFKKAMADSAITAPTAKAVPVISTKDRKW